MERDIRWIQRLDNYAKALSKFNEAVELYKDNPNIQEGLKDLLKEGLVQRFEYTQELAWNVMKDYESYQGETEIHGSRDAIRKALSIGIIEDSKWMNTIADRNSTSHNYDDDAIDIIIDSIINIYHPLFNMFAERMQAIANKECSV